MVNHPIEYLSKQVNPFGEMSLIKSLIDETQIWDKISSLNLPKPGSNRGYNPSKLLNHFG
jgi:hypothetical protein